MNKRMVGTAVGAFVCATGLALGQLYQSSRQSAEEPGHRLSSQSGCLYCIYPPVTPQEIRWIHRQGALARAAAAALDAGRYEEAEADARQSLALGVDSGLAQEILASALNAQGRTQEALEAYQQMADEGTDEPRNLLPYALLLLKAGQWAPAVEAYNKQLPYLGDPFQGAKAALMSTLGPFTPDTPRPRELAIAIHICLGVIYAGATWGRHSQDDKALREFEQAVALAPDFGLAHLYYGHKLQSLGRRAEAQAAFRRAAALGHGTVKAAAEEALSGQA